jgi:hypothetical protein
VVCPVHTNNPAEFIWKMLWTCGKVLTRNMRTAFKHGILNQFRGRKSPWILAFVLSSLAVASHYIIFRPTCGLMFYPTEVAKNYALAWLCLFVFIGVTTRAKLVFAVGVLVVLGRQPLVQYRIPTNERRTVSRLNEMQRTLRSATAPARNLSDIIGSELAESRNLSGYQIEYSPEVQDGVLKHYVIRARPQCYCRTGQHSFTLDDLGVIHYTVEDRVASLSDPVLRQD